MKPDDLPAYVDRMQRDVLAEALSSATAVNWQRRARRIASALPREGDFLGRAPRETPEQRCERVLAMVSACEARASVSLPVPEWVGVDDVPAGVVCLTCGTPTSPWTCSCGQTRVGDAA